jgi:hypothetical protein
MRKDLKICGISKFEYGCFGTGRKKNTQYLELSRFQFNLLIMSITNEKSTNSNKKIFKAFSLHQAHIQ